MSRERDPEADPHAMEPEDMSPEAVSRRKLLKIGVGVLGGGLALVPLVPALGYWCIRLRRGPGEAGGDAGGRQALGVRQGAGASRPVRGPARCVEPRVEREGGLVLGA